MTIIGCMATLKIFVLKSNGKLMKRIGKALSLMLLVLLAACGSNSPQDSAELPTLAQLPTQNPTTPPTATSPVEPSVNALPTETSTVTVTPSLTLTVTPSATITDTPTPTATVTPPATATEIPTADNEGLVALALMALNATVLPQTVPQTVPQSAATLPPGVIVIPPAPTTNCVYPPPGGFGTIFINNPTVAQQIGCPVGAPPITASVLSAAQHDERGEMIWLAGPPASIYVMYGTGRFQRYDDTFNDTTDPASGGETPPSGLKEPVRGFGKVWRTYPEVRTGLGWATDDESGGQATVQVFERGQMFYLPERGSIYILINDPGGVTGTWQAIPGSF